jgi:putative tryptophan/tyrosine transport system substrate-binding protein
MRRRDFPGVLGGAAAAWPFAAQGQQLTKQHRIAFVHSGIRADRLTESAGPFWVGGFLKRFVDLAMQRESISSSSVIPQRAVLTALAFSLQRP